MIVGIPTLNRYDKLELCLQSILESSLVPTKILVVDNGNFMPATQKDMANGITELFIYTPNHNLGVSKSWNWMIDVAKEPIIICNDDVKFSKHDIEAFQDSLVANEHGDFFYTANLISLNMFSCFLIKPETFAKVGSFDETFYPAYFEDNDYYRRMLLKGMVLIPVPTNISHTPSSTFQAMTPEQQANHHGNFVANRSYYMAKWGGLPHEEEYLRPFNRD